MVTEVNDFGTLNFLRIPSVISGRMVEVEELESGGLSGVVSGRMDEVEELESGGLSGEKVDK